MTDNPDLERRGWAFAIATVATIVVGVTAELHPGVIMAVVAMVGFGVASLVPAPDSEVKTE